MIRNFYLRLSLIILGAVLLADSLGQMVIDTTGMTKNGLLMDLLSEYLSTLGWKGVVISMIVLVVGGLLQRLIKYLLDKYPTQWGLSGYSWYWELLGKLFGKDIVTKNVKIDPSLSVGQRSIVKSMIDEKRKKSHINDPKDDDPDDDSETTNADSETLRSE
jgi:hypothetical protein